MASKVDMWRCHTPNLLKEILHNPGTGVLAKPINIFGRILHDLAEHAATLNDPKLNAFMIRLTLYEVADPEMPAYDPAVVERVLKEAGMNVELVCTPKKKRGR